MLNASQSLPGARLILVSLVMRPAIRPFCTRHWGVCDGVLMFVRLHQCVFVSAYSRFVWFMCVCICVLADPPHIPPPCVKTCTVSEGEKAATCIRSLVIMWMLYVSRQHASAKQGGPCSPCQGSSERMGQAPERRRSLLAQFTKSLAPQTLLLASSPFSPSVLASQQPARNRSVGMRLEDSIQKDLMADGGLHTDWL